MRSVVWSRAVVLYGDIAVITCVSLSHTTSRSRKGGSRGGPSRPFARGSGAKIVRSCAAASARRTGLADAVDGDVHLGVVEGHETGDLL
jgi:hypothetical protein